MRIERNRVLTQWQQEKRVQALVEEKNRKINENREEENCAVIENLHRVEKELDSEKAEVTRLRALCDELMASSSVSGHGLWRWQWVSPVP